MTQQQSELVALPVHPFGVRPTGNAYTADRNIKNAAGKFNSLPDEIIIEILELLEPVPLVFLGSTCKALYAFSRFEELWKAIVIR